MYTNYNHTLPVEYCFPQNLQPEQLDDFLARGWFRSSQMLYRSDLLCMENDIYSPVNIRLNLTQYQFSKSLRKILNRVRRRFRTVIQPLSLTPTKEELYKNQLNRFRGFLFNSLDKFLHADLEENYFDTLEINVFDGDKLIACSFFDRGRNSLASILGLYDISYARYSLGIYTMLEEIEYAQRNNRLYYYPGYILDRPSEFDYKLRLGEYEYHNWQKNWVKASSFNHQQTPVSILNQKINHMITLLRSANLPFETKLYPLFSLGYMDFFTDDFVRSAIFLRLLPAVSRNYQIILEYNFERGCYQLCKISERPDYQEYININHSLEVYPQENNLYKLWGYDEILLQTNDTERLMAELQFLSCLV